MTREEFYKQDKGERNYYKNTADEHILLPVTKDGFEALLERATTELELPIDDRLRSHLAGYIHHIASDEMTMNYDQMKKAIYKSFSNSLTYDIDQEAKLREMAKFKKDNPDLNGSTVTPIKGH